jgi:hypothetical protein
MSGLYDEKIKELKKKIEELQLIWNIIINDDDFNDEIKRLEKMYNDMMTTINNDSTTWCIVNMKEYEKQQAQALINYIWELNCNKVRIFNELQKYRKELDEIDTEYRETLFTFMSFDESNDFVDNKMRIL